MRVYMNIFVLSNNIWDIPKHYCDLHLNKMLLEATQLLCSVYENAPYKRTHYNHPCAKWVRTNRANFMWLKTLAFSMYNEYWWRRRKHHKCGKVLAWMSKQEIPLPHGKLTEFPQCMPDEYKIKGQAIKAYRKYYASKLREFRRRGICKFTKPRIIWELPDEYKVEQSEG